MTVLIFGKNGQLARALERSLLARKTPFQCKGQDDIDLYEDSEQASKIIAGRDISAVINASGYTDVDGAETHEGRARILNAKAPGVMAVACQKAGLPFIHISTDYVFDGEKQSAYRPSDQTRPLNAYGRTKRAGERAVLAAGGRSLILRTSWIYDGTGRNFLTSMLNLAHSGEPLKLVNNQWGRPTYAGHLAEACVAALDIMPKKPAIHHISNSGPAVNWAGFAREIFRQSGLSPQIEEVPDTVFPRPAHRPENSLLDVSGFEKKFRHHLLPWPEGIGEALSERHVKRAG